jgi:hypothetical protein
MNLEQVSPGLVVLLMVTGLCILMVQKFRLAVVALAAQYLLVFLLITSVLPSSLALVKLLVGWMITALFVSEIRLIEKEWENRIALSGNLLRGGILLFLWIVVYLGLPLIQSWVPVPRIVLLGGMILLSSGLIQTGLSNQVLRISIGLLTLFSGFEVIYAALESSVLVSGLLVLVNIGIGLTGLFLVIRGNEENEVVP